MSTAAKSPVPREPFKWLPDMRILRPVISRAPVLAGGGGGVACRCTSQVVEVVVVLVVVVLGGGVNGSTGM